MERSTTGDLEKAVAAETGLPEATVHRVIRALLRQILGELADYRRVTLTGFGSFSPKIVAPRRCYDPQSGGMREMDARGKVQFSPGKGMRDEVEAVLTRMLQRGVQDSGDFDPLIVLVDSMWDEEEDAEGGSGASDAGEATAAFRRAVLEAGGRPPDPEPLPEPDSRYPVPDADGRPLRR